MRASDCSCPPVPTPVIRSAVAGVSLRPVTLAGSTSRCTTGLRLVVAYAAVGADETVPAAATKIAATKILPSLSAPMPAIRSREPAVRKAPKVAARHDERRGTPAAGHYFRTVTKRLYEVAQAAPLSVKAVGAWLLVVQVPWNPAEALAPGLMMASHDALVMVTAWPS